jgi:hypothetical protein
MQSEATEGLNPQDEQRAHSMADEGGAAGAVVEAQEPGGPRAQPRHWGWMATAAACGGLVAYWLKRR